MNVSIQFLGASGTVTGSKYLIETASTKIMVDCGLFQGGNNGADMNRQRLPVNPQKIDHIFLTHGHMDHTGYLPKIVADGFNGQIWGTPPTLNIADIILQDCAKISEEDYKRAVEKKLPNVQPPLYTSEDVKKTEQLFSKVQINEWHQLTDTIKVRFQTVGHIIGACFIELYIEGKKLVFSGDVGRQNDPLLDPPFQPEDVDYVFIESTYGDRIHPSVGVQDQLQEVINDTIAQGGNLIIPCFAVERMQTLMYSLWRLQQAGEIEHIPVYIDSPMGKNVLNVFHHYRDWHNLPIDECAQMCQGFHTVQSYKETWEVIDKPGSKIIIAGSGMLNGGRVLTYLKQMISSPENTVLITGYQAEGTRGRLLLEGAKEISFWGKIKDVKAHSVQLEGISAHADQTELINWLNKLNSVQQIFIIHGEPQAAMALQQKIVETYGWECLIPTLDQKVSL